jgi:hypothetical protein
LTLTLKVVSMQNRKIETAEVRKSRKLGTVASASYFILPFTPNITNPFQWVNRAADRLIL